MKDAQKKINQAIWSWKNKNKCKKLRENIRNKIIGNYYRKMPFSAWDKENAVEEKMR